MGVKEAEIIQSIIRKATVSDVDQIQPLIQRFADQGLMLPRSTKSLYEHIQNFTVAVLDDTVIGTAALHTLWRDLAEIRSLAVDPSRHGLGIGRMLVSRIQDEASQLGIRRVLSLTYQRTFFAKMGFQEVNRDDLPRKVWKDCVFCPKFDCCDEIAMIYMTSSCK